MPDPIRVAPTDLDDAEAKAAAHMLIALADVPPERQLDVLATVCKVVIEGHLPRFEDVLRRRRCLNPFA